MIVSSCSGEAVANFYTPFTFTFTFMFTFTFTHAIFVVTHQSTPTLKQHKIQADITTVVVAVA